MLTVWMQLHCTLTFFRRICCLLPLLFTHWETFILFFFFFEENYTMLKYSLGSLKLTG